MTSFAVDLEALSSTVSSLASTDARLAALLSDLAARVAALHLTWTGLAASAHADAHRDWEAGFADMRSALAAMRSAARVAHLNYDEAARLNTSLWEQLR